GVGGGGRGGAGRHRAGGPRAGRGPRRDPRRGRPAAGRDYQRRLRTQRRWARCHGLRSRCRTAGSAPATHGARQGDDGQHRAVALRGAPLLPGIGTMSVVKYTEEHEWISVEAGIGTVGITAYAQEQLGDVVYVELPEAGRQVVKGKEMAVVESVKAASEVYAPVSGEVVEANAKLASEPATVNADAQGAG